MSRPAPTEDRPPEQLVGDALLDAADHLRDVFTRACATEGLSMAEGRALRFLARSARQRDLADLLACAPSRVTALLHELERRGFIRRRRARGDKRQHDISVTREGLDALDRFHELLEQRSPLVRNLDAGECEQLRGLLLRLLAPIEPLDRTSDHPTDHPTDHPADAEEAS